MTARARLHALWTALDAIGATVHRQPLNGLTDAEIGALTAHEAERHRILTSPDADHSLWARDNRRHTTQAAA